MTAPPGSRVIVLGSCGAWPEPSRACSGYVVEHQNFRVVLDLGYATLPRLLARVGNEAAAGLDAVVITHHHPDHSIDLHGLFRARLIGGGEGTPPLPLYCPEAVVRQVEGLDQHPERVRKVFDWHPLPADPYELGPFRLIGLALPHYIPNVGIRLEAPTLTIAYTGDTGPADALVDLARDADLFIAEASEAEKSGGVDAEHYLAADEAARAAQAAGARRLLLTHLWPGSDRREPVRVARAIFGGDIVAADEDMVIELG